MERPASQITTNDAVATAICQIEQADLPAPVYRTARRLLDLAADTAGDVVLSRLDARHLCGSPDKPAADGTMRSHLIQLSSAGILQYHTNGFVAVRFRSFEDGRVESAKVIVHRAQTRAERSHARAERSPAYPQPGTMIEEPTDPRAERATDPDSMIAERSDARAERSHRDGRAPSDHPRALSDHARAPDDQNGDQWFGLVWNPSNPDPGSKPIQPIGPEPEPGSAVAMLVDVGIRPHMAVKLAHIPAPEVLRQIALWLPQHAAGDVGTGALIDRLQKRKPAPPITEEFKRSEFYHRHFPREAPVDDDSPEARRRKYIPDEYRDIILG